MSVKERVWAEILEKYSRTGEPSTQYELAKKLGYNPSHSDHVRIALLDLEREGRVELFQDGRKKPCRPTGMAEFEYGPGGEEIFKIVRTETIEMRSNQRPIETTSSILPIQPSQKPSKSAGKS